MTSQEQLSQWLLGNSVCPNEHGECCPDFSCCKPELLAPEEERQRFVQAVNERDEGTKMEMLGIFLGRAFQAMNKDVYVAGLNPGGES